MPDEEYFGQGKNLYHEWAKGIYEEAQTIAETEGCDPNPYQVKQLAIKLLRDCKQLPLWSNVVRDVFGYGRVPATSAVVESAFNDLKTRTLNKKVGLRADDFIKKHLDDISGATVVAAGIHRRTDDVEASPTIPACPICAEGTAPTAHFCVVCRKAVHLIFGCSEALNIDDEGFGQERICKDCHDRGPAALETILSSRETEKWGGKENEPPSKKIKKSFYMGDPLLPHQLKIGRSRSEWPILKNSSSLNLKPVNIKDKKVSLSFTCAFDATTQVLIRALEEPQIKTFISSWGTEYAEFLNELHDKGITTQTYKKRAEILIKLMPKNKISTSGTVQTVACDIVAAELVSLLLSTFAECNVVCEKCGYNNTITPKTISIADSELYRLENAVGTVLGVQDSSCEEPCPGYRRTETSVKSPVMMIDIYQTSMDVQRMKLSDIPVSISPMGRRYDLMGVVVYEIVGSKTRTFAQLADTVQHYSALLFMDGSWTVIDDMKAKTAKAKKQLNVVPAIIIYAHLD